jgi:hypothetical protein
VALADAYHSGGVFWFDLEGDGGTAVVCIEGREGSPMRYRLFQGARLPDRPEAVLIDLGSEEEGVIIPAISRYVESDDAQRWLIVYGRELITEYLNQYGVPCDDRRA